MVRSESALIQSRLRQALQAAYGDRLARAVLFGSRARGDARADSDFDVAVFLHRSDGLWAESGRLADIATNILDETGAVVNALAFPVSTLQSRTPLMHELRREGVEL